MLRKLVRKRVSVREPRKGISGRVLAVLRLRRRQRVALPRGAWDYEGARLFAFAFLFLFGVWAFELDREQIAVLCLFSLTAFRLHVYLKQPLY